MKRTIFLFITILFAFFVNVHAPIAMAQEQVIQTDTPLGAESPASPSSTMEPEHVNYELPYPGMLPDNPFYFLKVIRDGIVKMLINDPLKRAQFSLLNADKRIYAGKMLIDKGKDQLALETIIKSNNYLDDAIVAIKQAKKQNPKSMDVKPFLQQASTAIQKHHELMEEISQNIDTKLLAEFKIQSKRIDDAKKNVNNLLLLR